ncbi:MAG: uroporphyrinogen-III C-methyltransferase [Thermogutta sp.]
MAEHNIQPAKELSVPNGERGLPYQVWIVGAGPGDPRFLTVWARHCLATAEVVIYDYLVDPRVLELTPHHAERISLGHHSRGRCLEPEEINEILLTRVRAGRHVVRLKAGDPTIFGRFAEELKFLRQHGIRFAIIPGVTAGLAVGALAELPLTHPEMASGLAIVAGNEHADKPHRNLDYQSLAQFPGTVVYYMGVRSAGTWSRELIRHGKSPDTPAAIVRRCGWPEQQVWKTTLAKIKETILSEGIKPPAIIVLGEVASLIPARSWFTSQPLFGKRILVTRPEEQVGDLQLMLEAWGAYVINHPVIEVNPPQTWEAVDATIDSLSEFAWAVFSSANGVRFFIDRIRQRNKDTRVFAATKIAAIGPGTAAALNNRYLQVDLVPKEYRAESLAEELNRLAERGRILLIRASRGRQVLPELLTNAGWQVFQVVAYQSVDVTQAETHVLEQMDEGKIEWVTVTSSGIAHSLVRLFGERLRKTRLASISPVTTATLEELGFQPAVEAQEYTMRGLVSAILAHETR